MSSRQRKPQPLRKEKNKREHDNVAHGRKKKICAFKNHTVRLHGSFCRRHLLSDKNTSAQGLIFFFLSTENQSFPGKPLGKEKTTDKLKAMSNSGPGVNTELQIRERD